ncbi:hypothetical protein [Glycomyces algeriensis]|uniref:PPE family protein n=1 Tax=Glycomyces algeriensis TaxID=256037 RepID=A0A9W6G5P0_9ACTN|nr:hypothetical protein [Glycomyces algeriensis]MDA1367527.1 hypothetical protein [Glycomyces algeriensis]MDR7353110.1 uncharacterized protein YukE [Glycomyces algeriensis]GLI40802.1 hypothetical protein GALLR39Z86_06520 [Glycomyces algeriensis]
MSTGQRIMEAGEAMAGEYNAVIKGCAIGIAAPAIAFGLSTQALATVVYLNQCNPGDIMKGAGAWIALAEKNLEAVEALQAEFDKVNDENWSGDDAEAFKAAAGDVKAQLTQLAVNAYLVGAQLLAFAVMLTVFWMFLTAATAIMAVYFGAYLAALGGVVSAVGAPAILTSANVTAAALLATAKSFEATLISISTGCAAITGAMSVFTFAFQKAQGNPVSPLDIAGAGLTNMIEGLLVYGLNAATMTSGGRHATGALASGWALAGHLTQAASTAFPAYKGEDEGWETGFDGGGPLLGVPDSALNWLWEDNAPESMKNPEDLDWS